MKKFIYILIVAIAVFLVYQYGFNFPNEDGLNLNVVASIAGACEATEATWLTKQEECEDTDKTWCDQHQGEFSECESGCRHNDDPESICTLQCVGVCRFNSQIGSTINDFNSCAEAGNPIMESYPQQCRDPKTDKTYVENIGNIFEVQDLIELNSVRPNQKISSPLVLEGQAVGNWYFEGDFPVILTDWDGLIIAEGYLTAQSNWMTEDFVPFKGSLEFIKPKKIEGVKNWGALILKKDNPSGLPEHDNALEIPVFFE